MSPAKLNLGFATYGRTQSAAGQYTSEAGILAYYEICKSVSNVVYDSNYKVPHGTVSGQTCFYDNKQSIAEKVK
jgi:hypothetical protein